jgi:hypothetical protein
MDQEWSVGLECIAIRSQMSRWVHLCGAHTRSVGSLTYAKGSESVKVVQVGESKRSTFSLYASCYIFPTIHHLASNTSGVHTAVARDPAIYMNAL